MEKKKLFSFIVEELNRHSPGYDCWTRCWGWTSRYPSVASPPRDIWSQGPQHWGPCCIHPILVLALHSFFFGVIPTLFRHKLFFFFFSPHPHSLSWLTLGGKKYRRSPGHQASSSFYQHLIHHCCFLFFPLVEFMVCLQIHAIVFSSKGIHKERHNNDTREERWESWESWTLRSISRAGQSWILNSKTA